jgi:uncharacterized protein (DUF1778 family)
MKNSVSLDQIFFELDAESFAQFQAMLDTPPAPNGFLRSFLLEKSPWDKVSTGS